MSRLIPLRLRPSTDTRRSSTPSTPTSDDPPTIPMNSRHQRLIPESVPDNTIIPDNEEEWRQAMEEVKNLYIKRHYRRCSDRCIQVLASIKDPYQVHPLYAICLSFFAASSLEHMPRSVHATSSQKLHLLQQALCYYQKVESHIEYATFSADPTIIHAVPQSRPTSASSSPRSSVDSVFSQASSSDTSTSSSAASSPTDTSSSQLFHSDNITTLNRLIYTPVFPDSLEKSLKSSPLRMKKKVSFSLQVPSLLSEAQITLSDSSTIIDAFPSPPSNNNTSGPESLSPSSILDFFLSRALIRYHGHLSDFQNQIKYHISSVNSQITALSSSREPWRTDLPNIFKDLGSGVDGVNDEEVKKVELRARIQRLKKDGWKRKRFDGTRYQILCEKAMDELR